MATRVLLISLVLTAASAISLKHVNKHSTEPVERSRDWSSSSQACTALTNRGSHFSIELEVGTPGQKFDVVADTGSNAVIVQSCVCQDFGHCDKAIGDKCYRGTKTNTSAGSSTFMMQMASDGKMRSTVMSFGSGDIQAAIATDKVRIGSVEADMKDELFLMVNRALKVSGPFEGILGLGLPENAKFPKAGAKGASLHEAREAAAQGLAAQGLRQAGRGAKQEEKKAATETATHQNITNALKKEDELHISSFLEMAKVPQFTMCFNDGADGVLRLGSLPSKHMLGSAGVQHWGLDFRGISVGKDDVQSVKFCRPEDMVKGQTSPCGAIPDSGTTLIMARAKQLNVLFDQICDGWDRCTKRMHEKKQNQSDALSDLLMTCNDWLEDSKEGLAEMPALHLHMVGAEGKKQALKLPGSAYILEAQEEEVEEAQPQLWSLFSTRFAQRAQLLDDPPKTKKICMPAFGQMEYETEHNGPVWIIGTPLFYEFQVGYDLSQSPPSMSFSDKECGSCGDSLKENRDPHHPEAPVFAATASHLRPTASTAALGRAAAQQRRLPRPLNGKVRMPSYDTTKKFM